MQILNPFGQAYPAAGRQLAKIIDRPVLWFWAHEHRDALPVREHWEVRDGVPCGKDVTLVCRDPNIRYDSDLDRAVRP